MRSEDASEDAYGKGFTQRGFRAGGSLAAALVLFSVWRAPTTHNDALTTWSSSITTVHAIVCFRPWKGKKQTSTIRCTFIGNGTTKQQNNLPSGATIAVILSLEYLPAGAQSHSSVFEAILFINRPALQLLHTAKPATPAVFPCKLCVFK